MTLPAHLFTAIDHVGIAVADLDEAIAFYRDTFGMEAVHEETNVEQGVREAMVAVGDSGSCIQLLAPLTPESTIAKFLDRSGPGMQQLAYRVEDLDAVSATLRERGVRLLYDEARRGTSGSRVNFVHPKDAGGVLVELVEPSAAAARLTLSPPLLPLAHTSPHRVTRRYLEPNRPGCQEQIVQHILDAVLAGDTTSEDFAALDVPESYRGVTVHQDEVDMFEGLESKDKDPRKSLHVDDVPVPELGPGEALVAVMASAINYNTVWTSIFEPMATFGFLERYGKLSPLTKRHDLPYHVVGSDLAGVVLRTGPGVHRWSPGDEVVAHCLSVELESPDGHNDTMLDPEQRIWGFETNFGGLAEIALVKSNQLMPKAAHLTWEEAASPGLVNSTAYRQLVSRNGAGMKQGDNVLIWGASGGLGGFATQYALNGGATPVCVVSNEEKADVCRAMGAELIINRSEADYRFWKDEQTQDPAEWKRLGNGHPRTHRRRGRGHRLRAPGPRDLRRVRLRRAQGRHHRHLRLDVGLPARVRQPLPVDEPQADHRLPLRQLPRVLGGQPPDREGDDPPHAVAGLSPRRGRPGRAGRASQRSPGQGRGALPGPRGGAGRAGPADAGAPRGRDQQVPRRLIAI